MSRRAPLAQNGRHSRLHGKGPGGSAWLLAAFALWIPLAAGCAATGAGPARSPAELHRALLGRNPGLSSVRALVEARVTYAGNSVSLPGALAIDRLSGFRLDMLDPLDRPAAILFAEGGELIQYRPAAMAAASLAPFPPGCRDVSPTDWVPFLLSSSAGPPAGASERTSSRLFGNRILERWGPGTARQAIWFRDEEGELRPTKATWYCGDEAVLEVRVRGWRKDPALRFPARIEIAYPMTAYSLRLDVKEADANPAGASGDFLPRIGPDVRWWVWRLPK